MKRFSIVIAVIGLSAGAFAALPAAINPTEVNVPLLDGGFFIGVTGAYLQPSGSNGANDFLASINVENLSTLKNVDLDNNWGWGVNVGYIFPQTANDLNLSYFHLNADDTASATAPPGGVIGSNILNIKEKAEYDLDQIDLIAGQSINVGCRLRLHPNVGLRWANIEYTFDDNFMQTNQDPALPNGNVTASEKSDFDSIGPLAGVDASYYIGMGFGIVGHFDSALLVGDIDAKANATTLNFINPSTIVTIKGIFKGGSVRRVVPVTNTKLGIDYTYIFNNVQNSNLTLEVGYQVSNYFNAVDKLSVSAGGMIQRRDTSDMSLNGVYTTLIFHT